MASVDGAICCPITISTDSSSSEHRYLFEAANIASSKQFLESILQLTSPQLPEIAQQHPFLHITLASSDGLSVVNNKFKCFLCSELVQPIKMRVHVAKHIINEKKSHAHLCSYCGRIGCPIELVVTSGRGKNATKGPRSSCPFFYAFKLKPAELSNATGPCTNRPVRCSSCKVELILWSYNLPQHYREAHPLLDPPIISDDEIVRVLRAN